jgi:hypothetical protein
MVRRRYTRWSVTLRTPEPFDKLKTSGMGYYKFNSTPRNQYDGY